MDKKRILVFEDSDVFAEILLEFLKSENYETERAKNGFDGIKQVFDFLPDLIITEVELPVFKGFLLARFLKSHHTAKKIPLIMFATAADSKDRFWGEKAGADFYIEKLPENFSILADQIKKLTDESGITEENRKQLKDETKKINDASLTEMLNNLLENKLFQATIVGLLAELSSSVSSLDETVKGVISLLNNVCHSEICTIMIKDAADNGLIVYNANNAAYTKEIADDFKAITIADFNTRFSDYKVVSKEINDLFESCTKNTKIESYILLPLTSGGEEFATVHIGTSTKEYFSPLILENLRVFLDAASPIVKNALYLRQTEILQKKTRTAFARYVPVDVMDEIIRGSSAQITSGETRVVAILFSDIISFTKISEKTPAQEMVKFLNQYFSYMCNEIVAESGNIDKFIGDAIMAIFGAPRTLENSSVNAVKAALRMAKTIHKVDTSEITLPPGGFGAGIGINFGECVVGNIGFQNKLDYTVIGDTVNLASRLEGLTRFYKQTIIVSENIYANAKDHFIFRKVDSVKVKGKDLPVWLYSVYDAWQGEEQPETPSRLVINKECLDQYNKGLKLFQMCEWETARQYFSQAFSASDKKDFLSELYLGRAEEFKANPPPPDWDGTTTMTEK